MTGMAQGQPDDEQARAQVQPAAARPPLPGPADETSGPMTIIPGPAAEDSPAWRPEQHAPHTSPAPAHYQPQQPAPTGEGTAAASRTISGLMSDVTRNGRWEVPASLSLIQCMSDVTLDMREAIVTTPVVEVTFYGLMSDLKVIVPPGVEVELGDGLAIMSDERADQPDQPAPGAWRLRVTQYSMMSDVKVKALAPGEKPTKKWWKSKG